MKTKERYTYLVWVVCLWLGMMACQKEVDNALLPSGGKGKLTLQFQMTPAETSRSGNDGVTRLFYTMEDGELTPCEATSSMLESRAIGDGVTADGGGMADLTVFLVGENDRIIARKNLNALADVTIQTVDFELELGEYTVYAYANTIGNDWFDMPAAEETSFAAYKDSFLKPLNGTVSPTIANNRMPLTGMQTIQINDGENTGTIRMIRPVGKLKVTIQNNRAKSIEPKNMSLGNIFPTTGYVFPHEAGIYPEHDTNNPYHALPGFNANHIVMPGITSDIYESLIYEMQSENTIQLSLSINSSTVTTEDLTGKLNDIKDPNGNNEFVINMVGTPYYLGIDLQNQLIVVHESLLDNRCVWRLAGSGGQQRPIESVAVRGLYLQPNGALTGTSTQMHFGGGAEETIIYTNNGDYLVYSSETGFSATKTSSQATKFKFSSVSTKNVQDQNVADDLEEKESETESRPLTSIRRNQEIHLTIIFN